MRINSRRIRPTIGVAGTVESIIVTGIFFGTRVMGALKGFFVGIASITFFGPVPPAYGSVVILALQSRLTPFIVSTPTPKGKRISVKNMAT